MSIETIAYSGSELLSHVEQISHDHKARGLEHRLGTQAWGTNLKLLFILSLKEINLIQSHLQRYERPREPFDLHIRSQ
jgi:hypothetical protein